MTGLTLGFGSGNTGQGAQYTFGPGTDFPPPTNGLGFNFTLTATPSPEPASVELCGLVFGVCGLVAFVRRRRAAKPTTAC